MKRIGVVLIITLVLAACSSAASTPTPQPTSQGVVATEQANAAYNGPAWASVPLMNARTGETFTLASFAGKTVYVEPMATWCTNCRQQLPHVEAARLQLNANQYVFVGLSVAENVDNATLAKYVDSYGWHFTFAVAPDALTKGLVDAFGRTIVTPTSTPHIIIRPDGSVTQMETGFHTPDELVAELTAANKG